MRRKKLLYALIFLFSLSSFASDFGIRFSPVPLLVGMKDISFDIGISEKHKLSAIFADWDLNSGDARVMMRAYGVDYSYHFSTNFTDGFYLGTYGAFLSLEYTDKNKDQEGDVELQTYGILGGYQWCWTSFMMNLAVKAGRITNSTFKLKDRTTGEDEKDQDIPVSGVIFEYKIGWNF